MKPFLQLLAEVSLSEGADRVADTCYVFPTRRAGRFFIHYLSRSAASEQFMIMPEVLTIGEFCARFTDLAEASRLDQLCVLYNEYSALSSEIPDFDRFRFWGEMILDDFSDVDRYLADAAAIFTNVGRYREISSNYLTDEQRDIINRYWPDVLPPAANDESFWRHYEPPGAGDETDEADDPRSKFLKLWQVLGPLYDRFNAAMERAGLITGGRVYRVAADTVCSLGADDMPHRRYVFAGFGVLSTSELKIFRHLSRIGVADFYWDCNLPLFAIPGNRAMRFMERYSREFPSRIDLSAFDDGELSLPKVTVVGVPSVSGQARVAGERLAKWCDEGAIPDPDDAVGTAVVLADEAMFLPLVHSIPERFTTLNVTMGLPVRLTPVASLMHDIVSMQLRARKVRGEYRFYYEDLQRVLGNPVVKGTDPDGCGGVLRMIAEKRLYAIGSAGLSELVPGLAPLFSPVKNENSFREVLDYVVTVVKMLSTHLDSEDNPSRRLDLHFMKGYLQAVTILDATVTRRGINVANTTALQLVERIVNGEKIHFEGRPLKGLQVMGIADTRVLDFENVILMSMNEKVFPRRNAIKSFIPENIRRAFGLPTSDFAEATGAYTFFRLVSRARNVVVLYDSRNSGVGASEMSRYVSQLLYLSGLKRIRHISASFSATVPDPLPLTVVKTPEVIRKLSAFRSGGADRTRWLSASAINQYINCPMEFYLNYVEAVRIDEEIVDFMDSSTYGNVVHKVAQRIYTDMRGNRSEVFVTADALRLTAANRAYLDRLITQAINEFHNNLGPADSTPLSGETRVLGNIIRRFIVEMLRREEETAPFTFIDAEMERRLTYTVSPELSVNMVMFIDRVDRLPDGRMRFIDYKTGNDNIRFASLDQLFAPGTPDRRKALLQLLLYANLYCLAEGYDGAIQPFVYRFKSIFLEGLSPVKYGKEILDDYRVVNEEFVGRLNGVLTEMFDPEVPFTQAADPQACVYCPFKAVCGRDNS